MDRLHHAAPPAEPPFRRSRSLARLLAMRIRLLSNVWHVLYQAQRARVLAEDGSYARTRHPQYVGFVLILLGFLLQWPTLLTLLMFPVLVVMYARLAATEEAEMRRRFGADFEAYAARTPRFLPRWRRAAAAA